MFNRSSRGKRRNASNPLFIIPDFFLHVPNELCIKKSMATLSLTEMGKFLWEGRGKGLPCWLSQYCKTKFRQLHNWANFFFLPPQRQFPISFKYKVAIAKLIGKMQKKSGIWFWFHILVNSIFKGTSKNRFSSTWRVITIKTRACMQTQISCFLCWPYITYLCKNHLCHYIKPDLSTQLNISIKSF